MRGFFGVDRHPRSGVWRVRVEVPRHLRDLVGRSVFTKSLATKNETEARRRAPAAQAPFLAVISDAQARFDEVAGHGQIPTKLTREATGAAISRWVIEANANMAEAIWARGPKCSLAAIFPEFGAGGADGFVRSVEAALVEWYGRSGPPPDCDGPLETLLRRIMTSEGILVPDMGHPAAQAALALLRSAVLDIAARQRALRDGDWNLSTPGPVVAPAVVPSPPVATPVGGNQYRSDRTITVKAMLEGHITANRPSASSESEMRLAVRRLLAFLETEDIDLNAITFDHAERFVDALRHLPKHMKDEDWDRGCRALVEDYKAGRDTRPRLSAPTVAKTVSLLHAMQRRAFQRGRAGQLVFGGLVTKADSRPINPRLPFTAEQIARIFTAPVFTGCAGPKNWRDPGQHFIDNERRWLPLLAATMGVRLEEGGQLLVSDVRTLNGIVYIDITDIPDDDVATADTDVAKSLKTEPSRRRVPIPTDLVAVGFLDYVERRRIAGDVRLFPRLKRNAKGKWTAAVSQWFNRDFLAAVGIKVTSPHRVVRLEF